MLLLSNLVPQTEYQVIELRVFEPVVPDGPHQVELSVVGWRNFPPVALTFDRVALDALAADPEA